ncbi:MAG: NAD-dependent epimerase/dehydratase family protein [Gemmatimonadetes bacterium]|nr:NAD-dependent epimerase/dehydratase family protein [Gemmatimonadota bacterium]MBT6146353.1 NAD-dependent epimerase/dehydratase family protein [Gemmatimonadota bacterium]MBT7862862.1 NAD-dependent epimerase/dehydratase family protein [Gemmatimonadota bacterium]
MNGPLMLVTGGSGYTGRRLVRRLVSRGQNLRLLLRVTSDTTWLRPLDPQPEVVYGDLEDEASVAAAMGSVERVIHVAHIRYSSAVASAAGPRVERIVFVSSLRAVSQVPCPTVEEVHRGEVAASAFPASIILRPSMIYGPMEGDLNDRNLHQLSTWIARRGWVPVIGADSLHQPVHVEDVVDAILAANDRTITGTFDIAGPEPMSYGELITTVGGVIGQCPRLIRFPAGPLIAAFRVWRSLRLPAPVDLPQLQRLLEDKSYDIAPARQHLEFRPRTLADGLRGDGEAAQGQRCH